MGINLILRDRKNIWLNKSWNVVNSGVLPVSREFNFAKKRKFAQIKFPQMSWKQWAIENRNNTEQKKIVDYPQNSQN